MGWLSEHETIRRQESFEGRTDVASDQRDARRDRRESSQRLLRSNHSPTQLKRHPQAIDVARRGLAIDLVDMENLHSPPSVDLEVNAVGEPVSGPAIVLRVVKAFVPDEEGQQRLVKHAAFYFRTDA